MCQVKGEESILGITGEEDEEEDDKNNITLDHKIKPTNRRPTPKSNKRPSKPKRQVSDFDDEIKQESDGAEVLPVSKRMKTLKDQQTPRSSKTPPMVAIAGPSSSKKSKAKVTTPKDMKQLSIPLLTLKTPNQRERKRETEGQKKKNV